MRKGDINIRILIIIVANIVDIGFLRILLGAPKHLLITCVDACSVGFSNTRFVCSGIPGSTQLRLYASSKQWHRSS